MPGKEAKARSCAGSLPVEPGNVIYCASSESSMVLCWYQCRLSCAVQAMGTLLRGRLMRTSDIPTPSTEERCATSIRESYEGPVLMAINAERRKQGVEPLPKLTVCL